MLYSVQVSLGVTATCSARASHAASDHSVDHDIGSFIDYTPSRAPRAACNRHCFRLLGFFARPILRSDEGRPLPAWCPRDELEEPRPDLAAVPGGRACVHSRGASRGGRTARPAPAAFSRHSCVRFSAASLEFGEARRFGVIPAWSAITEAVASALSLMRFEAQQRGRNLVLAIHTTGPMIRATRLLDALAATEARLRAAIACAREADSVVVDVGDSRIDAAVKQLFNKRHYLQMLKSGRLQHAREQCRDVNGVVVF